MLSASTNLKKLTVCWLRCTWHFYITKTLSERHLNAFLGSSFWGLRSQTSQRGIYSLYPAGGAQSPDPHLAPLPQFLDAPWFIKNMCLNHRINWTPVLLWRQLLKYEWVKYIVNWLNHTLANYIYNYKSHMIKHASQTPPNIPVYNHLNPSSPPAFKARAQELNQPGGPHASANQRQHKQTPTPNQNNAIRPACTCTAVCTLKPVGDQTWRRLEGEAKTIAATIYGS